MKTLIAFVAILGVAYANPGLFGGNIFGDAAEAVVKGATGMAEGAAHIAGGAAEAVVGGAAHIAGGAAHIAGEAAEAMVGGAAHLAGGAAHVVGKTAEVMISFQKNGIAEYDGLFQYYTDIGIHYFPKYGCCSCPAPGVVQPGLPNYSAYSPFSIFGVCQIQETQFCTCPPDLVASVVLASHHKPGLLGGSIGHQVEAIPRLEAQRARYVRALG